ncbi:von Willebrand factor A domain-containing protein 5A-like [Ambystoma mexicanum]|uniref:von Willebrand factor A domain-containing protein 5A-like n=1 Tax=Ambystoma mexicanum TaxID=8296 RepID=UPI0037E9430B
MSSDDVAHPGDGPEAFPKPQVVKCYFGKRHPVPMAPPDVFIPVRKAEEDPVPKLRAAQNDGGSWSLNANLASALETTEEELRAKIPDQGIDDMVWATILALVWLHATSQTSYDDWEILKAGAICWLRTIQDLRLDDCVKAANSLLGTCVDAKVIDI